MAIAKMKQMTLLAEQENKDSLLKAVQELQKLEMVELSTLEESEFLDYYSTDTAPQKRVEYEEKLKEIQATLNFLNQHISQPGMIAKLKKVVKSTLSKNLKVMSVIQILIILSLS